MPAPKDTLRSAAGEHSSAGVRTGRERVERIITSGGDTDRRARSVDLWSSTSRIRPAC
jgi:hypothetical protein